MSDFKVGDEVEYKSWDGPERGVVTQVRDDYVFVRFRPEQVTGQACYRRDLRPVMRNAAGDELGTWIETGTGREYTYPVDAVFQPSTWGDRPKEEA